MSTLSFSGLRFRLLLLVFFAVLPALAVVMYTASERQRQVATEIKEDAQRLVKLAASNQEQLMEKARQFAVTLSRLPVVRNGKSAPCSTVRVDLLQHEMPYANFGAARLNGEIYCSAVFLKPSININSKTWFKEIIQKNNLAVSDCQIKKVTGRQILILSYPVRNAARKVQAVVFTALDIAQISELAERVQLPEEAAIAIFDRNGTILDRHPHPEKWRGKSMPEVSLVKTILNRKKVTVEIPGLDGKPRLYAFSPLNSLKTAALSQANWQLLQNLAGIGVVGLLMLAAAWVGSDLFILRQVRALLRATKQLAAGDLATRIGLPDREGEVNQLAAAFDQMAETLQKRQEELTRINRSLKTLSDCNQALIRATEEVNLLQDICTIIASVGGYRLAWVGFAEPDEAKSVRVVASAGCEAGYLESLKITYADADRGQGPTGRAIRTGEVYIAKNILTDENYIPWRAEAIARGCASSISLPLMAGDRAFGALNIYATEPDAFDAEEVKLLRELAADMAYGIQALRSRAERDRAEQALRESEERYRNLVELCPDAIFIQNEGKFVFANSTAVKLYGAATLDEIIGKPVLDFVHPDFREVVGDRIRQLRDESKEAPLLEEKWLRLDGSIFDAEVAAIPFIYQGKPAAQVVVRDISDSLRARFASRKQAEKALSQLAAIVESSDDAIIGKSLEGIIQTWNAGAEKIYGYSAAEAKGRSISILIPPERPDEMKRIFEQIVAGCGIDSYETERIRKDGQRISVSLTVSPIKDAAGKVIGASSIARDISDRLAVMAALAKLRHQSELILNAVGDGIYGMDLQGNATFINLSAARMLGYEVGELMGQPMHATIHHSKPDGTPYPLDECPLYATFKDGSVHRVTDEVFWRKNGSSFPVEYVSTPIVEEGKIVGAVVTFKDITERRAIEQMKEEFISVVSHELRTPLTSIRTSLALLTSGLLENQPQRAQWMLEVAMESTHRLVRLVNDILDIERIESGKALMNKEACDAADLMVQAADVMRAMAEKAGVILSVTPLAAPLWADPDRVIQTLTNLLSNAIKFSPPDATISLTAERRGDWVLFQVHDRGRGIPADKLETIFGRFQQVDASDSRKQGGTGLGLAICRSIVQQHGGQIWAESILGVGSRFYFTLPVLL